FAPLTSLRASAGLARLILFFKSCRLHARSLALHGRSALGAPSSTNSHRHWLVPPSSLEFHRRAKEGGEGRTRTFEAARATDLQSAAFDRFATSPTVCLIGIRAFDEIGRASCRERREKAGGR